ncbi:MAG: response regulator transcription factor [Bacteroidota bacterium]
MESLRVALAEDIAALAKTMQDKIALFPELEFAFTARHGKDLLEKLEKDHDLDVILMDINMPVMDGIAATKEVRKRFPDIKIVMSTVFDEEDYIFQSILAGANGYLLKDERPQKILFSIQEAMEGGAPMSAGIAAKALGLIRKMADVEETTVDFNLTKRETEILEQLSKGQNYQQIADLMFISPGTVRKHIENIYQKLQVHSKLEAVQLALKHRLI